MKKDFEFFMGSPDDFLFINVALEEDIDICSNTPFETTDRVESSSKIDLRNFYFFCYKRVLFYF